MYTQIVLMIMESETQKNWKSESLIEIDIPNVVGQTYHELSRKWLRNQPVLSISKTVHWDFHGTEMPKHFNQQFKASIISWC